MKKIFLLVVCVLSVSVSAAQSNLQTGKMYYEMARQNGHPDYYRIALSNLQAAAKEGYGEACYLLGQMYRYGTGIKQDYTIAVRMYQRATEFGYEHGEAELGQMYEYGYGVPKDTAKALALYEKSAANGDLWGKTLLGQCYYYGILGCEQSYEKAFPLFEEAAEYYLFAKQMAGECYEYGRGVKKDIGKAIFYYDHSEQPSALYRAAMLRSESGNWGAASSTMVCAIKAGYEEADAYYYAGLWLDKHRIEIKAVPGYYQYDPESPFKMMTKAAEKGYGPAQKMLGDWYRTGLYVAVNLPKAREWYAKAKANGVEPEEENPEPQSSREKGPGEYAVGDLYRSPLSESVLGVVVSVDASGRHGLVLSLTDDTCDWGTADGKCAGGWRLPSRNELRGVQSSKRLLNDADGCERIFSQLFWSSESEGDRAWAVSMIQGKESEWDKSNVNSARYVLEF